MELIECGILSILPPLIAITLALITKEVISSLIIGILSGGLIYSFSVGTGIVGAIDVMFSTMASKIGDNAFVIIFLSLLGALVVLITMAGGSKAYGNWASKKIKSPVGAQLSTSLLGGVIFIDDYFNCLTVGTVMKPVTDSHSISRAKLAYIIDSTAAPICIIAPVSSWAASVISYMSDAGLNGMEVFIKAIPFNLYAILTLIMVVLVSSINLDFGQMAKFEREAKLGKDSSNDNLQDCKENSDIETISEKGTVLDLVIPILALIIFSILGMLYVGGYFSGDGLSIADAFGTTDASIGITFGAFGAIIVAFFMFVPRKLITFRGFMEGIQLGVKSMAPAFIILSLAWTIGSMCRDLLGTGIFVGNFVAESNIPVGLIPAMVFIVAGFLAFSMGTSWGTFAILIPIVAFVCTEVAPDLMIIALSATLAGAVFGDHCSPISDTTILSSTGAGCKHIDHVSSQIPYAGTVAFACFVGYIVAGFTQNWLFTFGSALAVLLISLFSLHFISSRKQA